MDRNTVSAFDVMAASASLSARRAWIEILIILCPISAPCVALRKESVDRNNDTSKKNATRVALRKESVDRNLMMD